MAILVRGKSKCPICQEIIRDGEPVISLGNFVPNEMDVLWLFNDAAFHERCFNSHPLANKALARYVEIQGYARPEKKVCLICNKKITHPDDYFGLAHLTDDSGHPLYEYNYAQFHRACMKNWEGLSLLYEQIKALNNGGFWKGKALNWWLKEIQEMIENGA